MTHVIEHPDRLVQGAYVTVLRWKNEPYADPYEEESVSIFGRQRKRSTSNDYVGQALRVVALSYPFLAVRSVKTRGEPFVLDLRRVDIAGLSRSYVAAVGGWKSDGKEKGLTFHKLLGDYVGYK